MQHLLLHQSIISHPTSRPSVLPHHLGYMYSGGFLYVSLKQGTIAATTVVVCLLLHVYRGGRHLHECVLGLPVTREVGTAAQLLLLGC